MGNAAVIDSDNWNYEILKCRSMTVAIGLKYLKMSLSMTTTIEPSFNNYRALGFFLADWLVPCSRYLVHLIRYQHFGFQPNGFNFNQYIVDSQGHVINNLADIINH